MGFCKRKGVDCECLTNNSTCNSDNCYKKLPDIDQKWLDEDIAMTFKEKLIKQAERASEINIEEEINIIKTKMAENAEGREFTISLIKPTSNRIFAVGASGTNWFNTFIPKKYAPCDYRKKFVDALLGLGFEEKDISLETRSFKDLDYYDIKVTW